MPGFGRWKSKPFTRGPSFLSPPSLSLPLLSLSSSPPSLRSLDPRSVPICQIFKEISESRDRCQIAPVPRFRMGYFTDFLFFSLSLAAKLGPLRRCLLPTTTTHDGGGVGSGRGRRRNGPQGRLPAADGYARDQRGTVGDMGRAAEEPEENLRRQVHHFHVRAPSALQEAPAILRQRQCRRVNESGTISAVGWCVPSCVVAASERAWCYMCGRCVVLCAAAVCVCARACVRVRVYACVCARACAIDEPSACN